MSGGVCKHLRVLLVVHSLPDLLEAVGDHLDDGDGADWVCGEGGTDADLLWRLVQEECDGAALSCTSGTEN